MSEHVEEPAAGLTLPPACIIAIDGPAASGKSTVGYAVAQRLDLLFFDTGIMYRAVAWAALKQGLDLEDKGAVGALAESLRIEIEPPGAGTEDGRQATVRVGNRDVTWTIRSPQVDAHVSIVAANARVRVALTRQQRRIGLKYGSGAGDRPGIVMVGRDIGTVVLPEAPLKIYLDAPVEERANRRYRELRRRGKDVAYEQILEDMVRRDAIDSRRAIAPLRPADDAAVIQTAGFTAESIVDRILALAADRLDRVGLATIPADS